MIARAFFSLACSLFLVLGLDAREARADAASALQKALRAFDGPTVVRPLSKVPVGPKPWRWCHADDRRDREGRAFAGELERLVERRIRSRDVSSFELLWAEGDAGAQTMHMRRFAERDCSIVTLRPVSAGAIAPEVRRTSDVLVAPVLALGYHEELARIGALAVMGPRVRSPEDARREARALFRIADRVLAGERPARSPILVTEFVERASAERAQCGRGAVEIAAEATPLRGLLDLQFEAELAADADPRDRVRYCP